jgi:Icc-related predicted phosphoesterase
VSILILIGVYLRNLSVVLAKKQRHAGFQIQEESGSENREKIIEQWLIEKFRDKLRKASIISGRKDKPFVLYRNITEESEDALEEVATVNEKYVVVQVFSHGGFLPTRFQKKQIFTLDKFIRRILKSNRLLLLQCLDNLN